MCGFYFIFKTVLLLPRWASSSLLAEGGQNSDPPASAYRVLGFEMFTIRVLGFHSLELELLQSAKGLESLSRSVDGPISFVPIHSTKTSRKPGIEVTKCMGQAPVCY